MNEEQNQPSKLKKSGGGAGETRRDDVSQEKGGCVGQPSRQVGDDAPGVPDHLVHRTRQLANAAGTEKLLTSGIAAVKPDDRVITRKPWTTRKM